MNNIASLNPNDEMIEIIPLNLNDEKRTFVFVSDGNRHEFYEIKTCLKKCTAHMEGVYPELKRSLRQKINRE